MMLKLNVGCGPNGQFDGYVNIDNSPAVLLARIPPLKRLLFALGRLTPEQLCDDWSGVRFIDASRRLPYADGTVSRIYTSHFLEHIPLERARRALVEFHRVLMPGGIARVVVPDLVFHAERYLAATRALVRQDPLSHDRTAHDAFLETVCGAYLAGGRYGARHCYMYDLPTLVDELRRAGFCRIVPCGYRQGADAELASHDSRPDDSLHVEATKD